MSTLEGWTETRLGDLATLLKGISYVSSDYCLEGEGAYFITIKCVSKAGGFKPDGIKYFKGRIPEAQRLHPGDLLIANTDLTRAGDIVGCPVTVPAMDGDQITMSMDLSRLAEDSSRVDRRFLYYSLMTDSVRRFMKEHASGSTVLHLQTRAVPTLVLTIPIVVAEQSKISTILWIVDRAIEQTEALIAKQQRIKTGLMHDLLTRGIDEHGNIRSQQTHAFKDSPLGRIPVEWEVTALGEVIGPIVSGWSPTCDTASALPGEWAILKTTAVVWTGYDQDENKRLPTHLRGVPSIEVHVDDILITRKGPVERVGVVVHVNNTRPNLMIPDTVFRMRIVDESRVLPAFLPLALESRVVQSDWFQKKIGLADAQVNLNHSILRTTIFPEPNPDEQRAIVHYATRLSEYAQSEMNALAKLKSLKKGLMQDLLTGKTRVTPLLDPELIQ